MPACPRGRRLLHDPVPGPPDRVLAVLALSLLSPLASAATVASAFALVTVHLATGAALVTVIGPRRGSREVAAGAGGADARAGA